MVGSFIEKLNTIPQMEPSHDRVISNEPELSSDSKEEFSVNTSVKKEGWLTRLDKFLEIKQEHVTTHERSLVQDFIYNDDLRPVENSRRIWSWKEYMFFWISASFNINTWEVCATGLQLGLNWWQCWITIIIGYTFVSSYMILSARVGNFYHISFPIVSRAAFGVYFSLWIVLNRVVMACVWYSVQCWIGGQCIQLVLYGIFGNDVAKRIPNHFGSDNATTFEFMSFIIFCAISLPFIYTPPHKLKGLFTFKSYITPIVAISFLVWTLVKAKGHLALGSLQEVHPKGSVLAWVYIRAIMSAMDNFATLILNSPDFSRFAKTERSSILSQLICIPVCYMIISIIGILVTSAAFHMYGINYWNPLDVLHRFLDHNSKGSRAGVSLIAIMFVIAQLASNIAQNSISAGTDMTALLPKYINIRRGGFICAALALCITPWNLLSSSSKFTTALAAYAVFLSSIAGVIAADYYVVRKGYIDIHSCYSNDQSSAYMYGKYGTNWRAVAAYIIGIVPNFPGFIGSVGPKVPERAMEVYYLNYIVGWCTSFVVYSLLCWKFPVPQQPVDNIFTWTWLEKWEEVEEFDSDRLDYHTKLAIGKTD